MVNCQYGRLKTSIRESGRLRVCKLNPHRGRKRRTSRASAIRARRRRRENRG